MKSRTCSIAMPKGGTEMTSSVSQRPFSVNTGYEINAKGISSEVLGEQNRTTNPALGAYLMLGVLILASIGGMLILCYKCEHPTSFQTLRGK
jgi:hypothetical protein